MDKQETEAWTNNFMTYGGPASLQDVLHTSSASVDNNMRI